MSDDLYEYLTVDITPRQANVPVTAYLPPALNQWASEQSPDGKRGHWRFKQLIGENDQGGVIVVLERKKQMIEVAREIPVARLLP